DAGNDVDAGNEVDAGDDRAGRSDVPGGNRRPRDAAAGSLSEPPRDVPAVLEDYAADADFVKTFSVRYARQNGILVLRKDGQAIAVVAGDQGRRHADIVNRCLRRYHRIVETDEERLFAAIDRVYSDRESAAQAVVDSIDTGALIAAASAHAGEDLLDTEGRAPIIQLVNQLLLDAVKAGASDIHIQPYESRVVVRQRIDGVLFDSFEIPKSIQEEVLTRIKVLGKMNIAEKRLPQDGRASVHLGATVVDLRIASLPTSHNERIVIRLLDKTSRLYTMDELGMPDHDRSKFDRLVRRDHGMILVTGPTGSGKSTTLYGVLGQINSHDLNVLTLEDPIEYQLEGISQTQINEKKGMTFASGMRSVLRQDPDIIMVGEIRDSETAVMAIQASLTGHLVFSTLHTNDAASAVTRLLDLGIEPYLVSSSLVASLAQRLVRRLCADCKVPDPDVWIPKTTPVPETTRVPETTQVPDASQSNTAFRAVGCPTCRGTGYRGRIGLFELMVIDDPIRNLVVQRASAGDIRRAGLAAGMSLLAEDGFQKVRQGLTTVDEVLRVTNAGSTGDGEGAGVSYDSFHR
ncbi:MAG: ATPase, T2SS/T4P/T4SS family, partial [Planctomycetota bacterium]